MDAVSRQLVKGLSVVPVASSSASSSPSPRSLRRLHSTGNWIRPCFCVRSSCEASTPRGCNGSSTSAGGSIPPHYDHYDVNCSYREGSKIGRRDFPSLNWSSSCAGTSKFGSIGSISAGCANDSCSRARTSKGRGEFPLSNWSSSCEGSTISPRSAYFCAAGISKSGRVSYFASSPGRISNNHGRMSSHVCASSASSSPAGSSSSKGGEVKRQVLTSKERTKLNPDSDRRFYAFPRFVTHVDDKFLDTLTALYRERIPEDAEVLDLMSSWVSHLPPEKKYKRVVGHGLNAEELARNPRLDYFFVKDLNEEPKLEASDGSFDAVLCTVSVQYMQQPEKVFAEIYRVLRPGGVCIVSFSNRMFFDKAVAAWRDGSDYSRSQLVVQYFQCVLGFTEAEVIRKVSAAEPLDESAGPSGVITWFSRFAQSQPSDPFYAVVAYRNFKPT